MRRARRAVRIGWITEHVAVARSAMVAFYVYRAGSDTICIDTGMSVRAAQNAVRGLGVDPEAVSHVFLTHSDSDHVGGVAMFRSATVHLGRDEEKVADGTVPRSLLFIRHRNHFGSAHVPIGDGQTVAVGSIRVLALHTPGHTPGSMSYLVNDEALFTGDLLVLKRARARPSSRLISEDVEQAAASISRLARDVRRAALLCTAHSGYSTDYAHAMERWREEGQT